jgi:DNA repair exonuclease SbcCD ATPase subunit
MSGAFQRPEELDTVAAGIESLPVGGRMVGVISHVPEVRQPARLS